ncbi:MAG: CRISPR system precrRNA processing endoribonuclease RAMP protein Cas6 [Anaerolineae bacterium]|nr:CRISPR system precrRNA processing endoribonuclease RAMP protein Cas6 [Anaerolineae bacterium]
MPYLMKLRLQDDQVAALPRDVGRALHALVYQWFALGDYSLSVDVHDHQGARPFTVALVYSNHQPVLRVTLLDDTLEPALTYGIQVTKELELLNHTLTLPKSGPSITKQPHADLLTQARPDTRIGLRFLSPTSFRSREMHYPLPDPVMVFQSWLNRWNEFAPEEYQINVALLDIVAAHVAVSRYSGRTELVDFGANKRVVGFTGFVQYSVIRSHKIGEEWLRKLNALADYAVFCGTGHKTAQGMGVTERE